MNPTKGKKTIDCNSGYYDKGGILGTTSANGTVDKNSYGNTNYNKMNYVNGNTGVVGGMNGSTSHKNYETKGETGVGSEVIVDSSTMEGKSIKNTDGNFNKMEKNYGNGIKSVNNEQCKGPKSLNGVSNMNGDSKIPITGKGVENKGIDVKNSGSTDVDHGNEKKLDRDSGTMDNKEKDSLEKNKKGGSSESNGEIRNTNNASNTDGTNVANNDQPSGFTNKGNTSSSNSFNNMSSLSSLNANAPEFFPSGKSDLSTLPYSGLLWNSYYQDMRGSHFAGVHNSAMMGGLGASQGSGTLMSPNGMMSSMIGGVNIGSGDMMNLPNSMGVLMSGTSSNLSGVDSSNVKSTSMNTSLGGSKGLNSPVNVSGAVAASGATGSGGANNSVSISTTTNNNASGNTNGTNAINNAATTATTNAATTNATTTTAAASGNASNALCGTNTNGMKTGQENNAGSTTTSAAGPNSANTIPSGSAGIVNTNTNNATTSNNTNVNTNNNSTTEQNNYINNPSMLSNSANMRGTNFLNSSENVLPFHPINNAQGHSNFQPGSSMMHHPNLYVNSPYIMNNHHNGLAAAQSAAIFPPMTYGNSLGSSGVHHDMPFPQPPSVYSAFPNNPNMMGNTNLSNQNKGGLNMHPYAFISCMMGPPTQMQHSGNMNMNQMDHHFMSNSGNPHMKLPYNHVNQPNRRALFNHYGNTSGMHNNTSVTEGNFEHNNNTSSNNNASMNGVIGGNVNYGFSNYNTNQNNNLHMNNDSNNNTLHGSGETNVGISGNSSVMMMNNPMHMNTPGGGVVPHHHMNNNLHMNHMNNKQKRNNSYNDRNKQYTYRDNKNNMVKNNMSHLNNTMNNYNHYNVKHDKKHNRYNSLNNTGSNFNPNYSVHNAMNNTVSSSKNMYGKGMKGENFNREENADGINYYHRSGGNMGSSSVHATAGDVSGSGMSGINTSGRVHSPLKEVSGEGKEFEGYGDATTNATNEGTNTFGTKGKNYMSTGTMKGGKNTMNTTNNTNMNNTNNTNINNNNAAAASINYMANENTNEKRGGGGYNKQNEKNKEEYKSSRAHEGKIHEEKNADVGGNKREMGKEKTGKQNESYHKKNYNEVSAGVASSGTVLHGNTVPNGMTYASSAAMAASNAKQNMFMGGKYLNGKENTTNNNNNNNINTTSTTTTTNNNNRGIGVGSINRNDRNNRNDEKKNKEEEKKTKKKNALEGSGKNEAVNSDSALVAGNNTNAYNNVKNNNIGTVKGKGLDRLKADGNSWAIIARMNGVQKKEAPINAPVTAIEKGGAVASQELSGKKKTEEENEEDDETYPKGGRKTQEDRIDASGRGKKANYAGKENKQKQSKNEQRKNEYADKKDMNRSGSFSHRQREKMKIQNVEIKPVNDNLLGLEQNGVTDNKKVENELPSVDSVKENKESKRESISSKMVKEDKEEGKEEIHSGKKGKGSSQNNALRTTDGSVSRSVKNKDHSKEGGLAMGMESKMNKNTGENVMKMKKDTHGSVKYGASSEYQSTDGTGASNHVVAGGTSSRMNDRMSSSSYSNSRNNNWQGRTTFAEITKGSGFKELRVPKAKSIVHETTNKNVNTINNNTNTNNTNTNNNNNNAPNKKSGSSNKNEKEKGGKKEHNRYSSNATNREKVSTTENKTTSTLTEVKESKENKKEEIKKEMKEEAEKICLDESVTKGEKAVVAGSMASRINGDVKNKSGKKLSQEEKVENIPPSRVFNKISNIEVNVHNYRMNEKEKTSSVVGKKTENISKEKEDTVEPVQQEQSSNVSNVKKGVDKSEKLPEKEEVPTVEKKEVEKEDLSKKRTNKKKKKNENEEDQKLNEETREEPMNKNELSKEVVPSSEQALIDKTIMNKNEINKNNESVKTVPPMDGSDKVKNTIGMVPDTKIRTTSSSNVNVVDDSAKESQANTQTVVEVSIPPKELEKSKEKEPIIKEEVKNNNKLSEKKEDLVKDVVVPSVKKEEKIIEPVTPTITAPIKKEEKIEEESKKEEIPVEQTKEKKEGIPVIVPVPEIVPEIVPDIVDNKEDKKEGEEKEMIVKEENVTKDKSKEQEKKILPKGEEVFKDKIYTKDDLLQIYLTNDWSGTNYFTIYGKFTFSRMGDTRESMNKMFTNNVTGGYNNQGSMNSMFSNNSGVDFMNNMNTAVGSSNAHGMNRMNMNANSSGLGSGRNSISVNANIGVNNVNMRNGNTNKRFSGNYAKASSVSITGGTFGEGGDNWRTGGPVSKNFGGMFPRNNSTTNTLFNNVGGVFPTNLGSPISDQSNMQNPSIHPTIMKNLSSCESRRNEGEKLKGFFDSTRVSKGEQDTWRTSLSTKAAPEKSWLMKQNELKADEHTCKMRKLRGILNKLTFEKFDILYQQILEVGIQKKEEVEGLMKLVFEKAVTQHHFVPMYVELCKRLSKHFTKGDQEKSGSEFKLILVNQCQDSFENNLKPIEYPDDAKIDKFEYEQMHKSKVRGNMLFVGELLKSRIISIPVMFVCTDSLLDERKKQIEETKNVDVGNLHLEALCMFLQTIGELMDTKSANKEKVDTLYQTLSDLAKDEKIVFRVRCLIKDVIDNRNENWKRNFAYKIEGPSTLNELHDKIIKKSIEGTTMMKNFNSNSNHMYYDKMNMNMNMNMRGNSMRNNYNNNNYNMNSMDMNSVGGGMGSNTNNNTGGGGAGNMMNYRNMSGMKNSGNTGGAGDHGKGMNKMHMHMNKNKNNSKIMGDDMKSHMNNDGGNNNNVFDMMQRGKMNYGKNQNYMNNNDNSTDVGGTFNSNTGGNSKFQGLMHTNNTMGGMNKDRNDGKGEGRFNAMKNMKPAAGVNDKEDFNKFCADRNANYVRDNPVDRVRVATPSVVPDVKKVGNEEKKESKEVVNNLINEDMTEEMLEKLIFPKLSDLISSCTITDCYDEVSQAFDKLGKVPEKLHGKLNSEMLRLAIDKFSSKKYLRCAEFYCKWFVNSILLKNKINLESFKECFKNFMFESDGFVFDSLKEDYPLMPTVIKYYVDEFDNEANHIIFEKSLIEEMKQIVSRNMMPDE